MERMSSSAVMRLGPLARRVLARRRRWLRWAAVGLAVLTLLTAAAQILHRPAPRRLVVSGSAPARTAVPRLIGVADVVPPGMRAVSLVVPAAATFGGRLAPWSRVDILAAFDIGQDRAVRRIVASGIVLHVATERAASAAATSPPAVEARLGGAPVAEIALAVPAAREQEVVMAQAFGRVFLAVDPTNPPPLSTSGGPVPRAASAASTDAGLSLRRYLGLPETPASSAAAPGWMISPPVLPPAPPLAWPATTRGGPRMPVTLPRAASPSSDTRSDVPHTEAAVEMIEGTARTVVEVSP